MALLLLAFLGGILKPLYSASAPLRVHTRGPALPEDRASASSRHGDNIYRICGAGHRGGGWVVRANQYGRAASLVVLAVFGLALLWRALADRLSRPFVQLGSSLAARSGSDSNPGCHRAALGAVRRTDPRIGPGRGCARGNTNTAFLLLAYAAGAATSLSSRRIRGRASVRRA
jgi:hypothetical protein